MDYSEYIIFSCFFAPRRIRWAADPFLSGLRRHCLPQGITLDFFKAALKPPGISCSLDRMVNHFKIMWRLVYGLLTAAETILATSALILVFMFVFSCVAVEVISKDKRLAGLEDTGFIISEYFGNLGKTVMTLMQFVTMDSLATIYFPLIVEEPLLLCFFLPILIFVSIGLMNLVTAASQL